MLRLGHIISVVSWSHRVFVGQATRLRLIRPCLCPSSMHAKNSIDFAEGVTRKPPTAHFSWHARGPPPVPVTVLNQLLVLGPLPLLCLLHSLFPGHSQLQ